MTVLSAQFMRVLLRAGGGEADQEEGGAKISLNVSTPPSLRPDGGRRTDLLIEELSLTQRAAGIRHHHDDDYSAPHVWNDLPLKIRATTCFTTFKRLLKTHFFRIAFK